MTNPPRHWLATAVAGIASCLLIGGCGSSGSSAHTGEAAPAAATSDDSTAAAAPATVGGDACSLVTEQEVTTQLGSDPGPGSPTTSNGASQCQYGSFQKAFVLVNLTPTQGKAAYDLVHGGKLGAGIAIADTAGLGDRAFEASRAGMATFYVAKGDGLPLVMVAIHTATSPPRAQALALATTAAARL